MKIEKLLPDFLDKVEKDHKALRHLKMSAVACQQYELAARIRETERELFPESEETKQAKKYGLDIVNVLGMVDLIKVDKKIGWLIAETLKRYFKKKGQFSLKDAAELKTKAEKLFENSQEL